MEYKKSIRDALEYIVPKSKSKFVASLSKEGDVILSDKEGKQLKTFSLPLYREPTLKEIQEMEQERRDRIVKAEEEISRMYPLMRAAAKRVQEIDDEQMAEKMSARSEYIGLVREMEIASAKYSQEVFPEKYVKKMKNMQVKMIDVAKYNDETVINHPINILKTRPFLMEQIFEREGEVPIPIIETPAEVAASQGVQISEKFIPIFQDQWLSPDIPINFQYDGKMYSSVRQAIEAWKARTGGDYQREIDILKAMTPMDARSLGVANKEIPAEVLMEILRSVNKFNSARNTLIRNLEEGTYIYMDIDVVLGVGMEGPLEGIISRANWMGQNKYGLAVTQMINEVKAAPESVRKRRIVRQSAPVVTAPVVTAPVAQPTTPAYNPFNMF